MATTQIQSAGYGVWNRTYICRNEAQGRIDDAVAAGQPTVTFFASNDEWGGDPSPGDRKYFFCTWGASGGGTAGGVVGEGDSKGVVVPTSDGS